MLYKIGTEKELSMLPCVFPDRVLSELLQGIVVLDAEYGADRDYCKVGGYALIAETAEDICKLKETIDYDTHPCEWATRIGKDTGYISALYILSNDFSVMVYLPTAIAPEAILRDLED